MADIVNILVVLVLGMVCGYLVRARQRVVRCADRLMVWTVYALLFFLGVSVGIDQEIVGRLGEFGVQALVLAVGGMAGSVAVTYGLSAWLLQGPR